MAVGHRQERTAILTVVILIAVVIGVSMLIEALIN